MATITVKNIPDHIYSTLKQLAEEHRRSINSEIIYIIEKATTSTRVDPKEQLLIARKMRKKLKAILFRIQKYPMLRTKAGRDCC